MYAANHRQTARAVVLAAFVFLAAASPGAAQDDPESLDRATEVLEYEGTLPDRPVLVGDRIVWNDHRLAGLCQEMNGLFRKLAGRAEYMCRLPQLAGTASTAME